MTADAKRRNDPTMPINSRRDHTGAADDAGPSTSRTTATLGPDPGDHRADPAPSTEELGTSLPDRFGQVINRPRPFPVDDGQPRQLIPPSHPSPRLPRTGWSNLRRTATGPFPHRSGPDVDSPDRDSRRGRLRGDDGAISVTILFIGMVVILFVAALIGGGALFAARSTSYDLAQSAARAGAQQIDTAAYRGTGQLRLDPARAAQAANQFLAAAGATGTVEVTAAKITVTATSEQATPMLAMFGFDTITVTSTASATPTTGPPA